MTIDDLGQRVLTDGILRITIDRQQVGNSLAMRHHPVLRTWFEEASADPEVRVVVLRGAGDRFFCTGADLAASATTGPPASTRAHGDIAAAIEVGWQRTVCSILDCAKPVVAALNGTAAGAGLHLALACDIVIAADHAKLIEVFTRRGICPDGAGAYLLTRLVGPRIAKEMMFFADDMSAERACELGLVNQVVPGDQVDSVAGAKAARLAEGPTRAIAMAKDLVNRACDDDRASSLWQEAWGQEVLSHSLDAAEGLRAFAEGRPARFVGR